MPANFIRIPPASMRQQFEEILKIHGFTGPKAAQLARIFMENSLDGVYTHGVNRFPRFMQYVRDGIVDVDGEPDCIHHLAAVEQWDGHSGPGPLNAIICTERAMEVAQREGIGCVALANTNHWMRGGTYGWLAAKAGFAFIGWTNTIANMPAWGATDLKLGNNPLVMAVPYREEAIVLDMAMSQFSFGTLEQKRMINEELTVMGGYNASGELSRDPGEILDTRRVLPVGYWKGGGLSLLLDTLATVLSGGLSVRAISAQGEECNLSQVFIAVALSTLKNTSMIGSLVEGIVRDYHTSVPSDEARPVLFPGERVLKTRDENRRLGIPVIQNTWDEVLRWRK
jgi:3-dehydro-L-gulonate 2-dehydrogenase